MLNEMRTENKKIYMKPSNQSKKTSNKRDQMIKQILREEKMKKIRSKQQKSASKMKQLQLKKQKEKEKKQQKTEQLEIEKKNEDERRDQNERKD